MLRAAVGLTQVDTVDLKRALKALHHGDLPCPLTIADLTRVGLQHCAHDLLETLRSLDRDAVRAVLVAVLAERLARERASRRRA
jgi:hypothetical protein